jgi:hypothetical protein
MRPSSRVFELAIALLCFGLVGCATQSVPPQRPVSAKSPLAKIHHGMTYTQVVDILGLPTSQSRQLTAQAFNPFAVGNQGQITSCYYAKLGRVVLAGPDFSGGGTEVISVEEDSTEAGYR